MDALDASLLPDDMDIPGFGFHPLRGVPKRYAVVVTGNFRITFGSLCVAAHNEPYAEYVIMRSLTPNVDFN